MTIFQKKIAAGILSLLIFICVLTFLLKQHHPVTQSWDQVLGDSTSGSPGTSPSTSNNSSKPNPSKAPKKEETPTPVPKDPVMMVDIKGQVQHPGVYPVSAEKRVIDVIQLAGGLQKDADATQINLAQRVSDEMVIFIPKKGETVPSEFSPPTTSSDSSAASTTPSNETSTKTSSTSSVVHLNSATLNDLETLPGIGPAKAQAIFSYRQKNGDFKSLDELANVSGIGEKTIERLKPFLTLD